MSNNPTENERLRRESRRHEYAKNNNLVLIILPLLHLNHHINSQQTERESGIPKSAILSYNMEFPALSEYRV